MTEVDLRVEQKWVKVEMMGRRIVKVGLSHHSGEFRGVVFGVQVNHPF